MKLSEKYPNFRAALLFLIGDKNPVLASNGSKKLSYFIYLANFEKGFDYYELDRLPNNKVRFSIVTMIGFRTVLQTSSAMYEFDLTENEWFDIIYKTTMHHFRKEEYTALKHGYVKKTKEYS